jgi:hypothetical protein
MQSELRNLAEVVATSSLINAIPATSAPTAAVTVVPPATAGPEPPSGTNGTVPPPAEAETAAIASEAVFVLLDADGVSGGRFQSLEAACHVAKTGAVIEIHHHGRFPRVQKPVLIQGKRITIRPAAGYRPQIVFAPADSSLGSANARMIEVVNGALELYDVDLAIEVSNTVYAEEWVMLSLTRVRELILQRVTMTIVNPGWRPAVMIERRMPKDAPTVMMPMAEPLRDSELNIRDCLFRGNCTAYLDRTLEPATLRMSDSVLAVEEDAFHIQGADRADMEGMNRSAAALGIELDHVTAMVGRNLVRISSESVRDLPETRIDCRNSILQATADEAPLLYLEGHQDSDVLLQRLRWFGSRNVIVTSSEDACVVRGLYPRGGDEWTYSLGQWQAQWQEDWEIGSESITSTAVLAGGLDAPAPYSELQIGDFALKRMSASDPPNPATGTASDSSDRGFRPALSSLPLSLSPPSEPKS